MKYEPKVECQVLLALQELGVGTADEVKDYLKNHEVEGEKIDIELSFLKKYLRRWKARKIISISYQEGHVEWKANREVPAWYNSGIMAIVKGSTNDEMHDAFDGLNKRLSNQGRIIEPRGVYGKFQKYKIIFETVDPILGGWSSGEDGKLIFPNVNGNPMIPANWFYGWVRSNAGIVEMPQSVCYHMAFRNGEFAKKPKISNIELKVKIGKANYEMIPAGTQFETMLRFPMRGTKLKSEEALIEFFKEAGELPLRGLGANPRALGGRIKLVKLKAI